MSVDKVGDHGSEEQDLPEFGGCAGVGMLKLGAVGAVELSQSL